MQQKTNQKYIILENKLTEVNGRILHRIQAVKDFDDVKAGDKGGWVSGYHNLSQEGDCWVYDESKVFDEAIVRDNTKIYGESEIYDKARILDNVFVNNAKIYDKAEVCGNVFIFEKAKVYGNTLIKDNVRIYGNACVFGETNICGNVCISKNSKVFDNAYISGNAEISGNACVFGDAHICGNVYIAGEAKISGNVELSGEACIIGNAVIKKNSDYFVFKNHWGTGRYFTYTKSNKMWRTYDFYGTGDELIKKAYQDSEISGEMYEKYVKLINLQEVLETTLK